MTAYQKLVQSDDNDPADEPKSDGGQASPGRRFHAQVSADRIPLLTNATHWLYGSTLGTPMGLYEPPWKYPAKTLAIDLSYHLVYGLGVAAAYEAL